MDHTAGFNICLKLHSYKWSKNCAFMFSPPVQCHNNRLWEPGNSLLHLKHLCTNCCHSSFFKKASFSRHNHTHNCLCSNLYRLACWSFLWPPMDSFHAPSIILPSLGKSVHNKQISNVKNVATKWSGKSIFFAWSYRIRNYTYFQAVFWTIVPRNCWYFSWHVDYCVGRNSLCGSYSVNFCKFWKKEH